MILAGVDFWYDNYGLCAGQDKPKAKNDNFRIKRDVSLYSNNKHSNHPVQFETGVCLTAGGVIIMIKKTKIKKKKRKRNVLYTN